MGNRWGNSGNSVRLCFFGLPARGAAMATLARLNWTKDGEASRALLRTGGVDAWSRGGGKRVECLSVDLHGLAVCLSINPARGRGGVKT